MINGSPGRITGAAGSTVTPLSLLKTKTQTMPKETGETSGVSDADDHWMAGYVLSIYRLNRATIGAYKAQVAARISV